MMFSGLNFWFKFRLIRCFLLIVILLSSQVICYFTAEGESNEIENVISKIFLSDSGQPGYDFINRPGNRDENGNLNSTSPENYNELVAKYIQPLVYQKMKEFDKNEPFTSTLNKHGDLANELVEVFISAPNITVLVTIGTHLFRNNINRGLLIHSLATALINRPDSTDYRIGKLFQMLTNNYLDGRLRNDILIEAHKEGEPRGAIEVWNNYTTASNFDPEHRIAYFREDLGINLHHWHWHMIHPYKGRDDIVKKDRRGELFYYFHQQIIARYNAERLSNKLRRVKTLNYDTEPIAEAYFPKLDTYLASGSWPSRPSGMILRDINRSDIHEKFNIRDLNRWVDRIYKAIYTHRIMYANETWAELNELTGIDILGNTVEASPNLSPDIDYYGQLHNDGHTAIAFIHDPDGSHMEHFGVMGSPATAMRDPVFYRWHAYTNDIFERYKETLPPYTNRELGYLGVTVSDLSVFENNAPDGKKNHLNTFWNWSVLKLRIGFDFFAPLSRRDYVSTGMTHLDHKSFSYQFKIRSLFTKMKRGIVRIFFAPRFDERGVIFSFQQQRTLMIEMDRFKILIPPGETSFVRSSLDSSVTIPWSSFFNHYTETGIPPEGAFAGCGWPQHMLLPKGTKEGFPMDLFVMISKDRNSTIPMADGLPKPAFSFCGIRGQDFPDPQSMGYPFDREANMGVNTLAKFLLPNMATTTIKVQFTDAYLVEPPPEKH